MEKFTYNKALDTSLKILNRLEYIDDWIAEGINYFSIVKFNLKDISLESVCLDSIVVYLLKGTKVTIKEIKIEEDLEIDSKFKRDYFISRKLNSLEQLVNKELETIETETLDLDGIYFIQSKEIVEKYIQKVAEDKIEYYSPTVRYETELLNLTDDELEKCLKNQEKIEAYILENNFEKSILEIKELDNGIKVYLQTDNYSTYYILYSGALVVIQPMNKQERVINVLKDSFENLYVTNIAQEYLSPLEEIGFNS